MTLTSKLLTRMAGTSKRRGLVFGYRSGLEEKVGEQITKLGFAVQYEAYKIAFTPPLKLRTYTPDFVLPNGIVIETKGRFMTADRQKHKFIQKEHPDLDIRFVFSNSRQKLSKKSPTTYGMWCDQYGFQYADALIPISWFEEPSYKRRLAAIQGAIPPPTKSRSK